jgi:hypothetical protein
LYLAESHPASFLLSEPPFALRSPERLSSLAVLALSRLALFHAMSVHELELGARGEPDLSLRPALARRQAETPRTEPVPHPGVGVLHETGVGSERRHG